MKLSLNFLKNIPKDQCRVTFATKLTILRILLVPLIILLMVKQYWHSAFLCIIISAITDLFDGIIARMRNETTLLGAMLDPIADKLFILSCYFILSFGYFPGFILPLWFTILIFCKEILLVFGALILNLKFGIYEIRPTILGKITMDLNTLFIVWIFVSHFLNLHFAIISNIFIFAISILVLLTFLQYVKISLNQMKNL